MEKKNQHGMCTYRANFFIESIIFFSEMLTYLPSLTSDPLFSIFVTFYTLIFLYFPGILLSLIFSPILISTGLLLSTLIRLGSNQTPHNTEEAAAPSQEETFLPSIETLQLVGAKSDIRHDPVVPSFCESMIEWNRNMGAPLEVIYEEFEGEEEHHWHKEENHGLVARSLYYAESDTDSSSEGDFPAIEGWESPENMCFRWDEEDKDGLIEIPLDGKSIYRCSSGFEEENMIEIDIGAPL